jgi:hypothetical protein
MRGPQPGRSRELDDGGPIVGVLGELGQSGQHVLVDRMCAQRIENLSVQPAPMRVADARQDGL